ncbi:hypothetical protein ACQP2Y_20945 [Actinoplanes sp. CA-051413]|uniref:hypothetical protein n=1 Tax=Actinoplanes sp. CA-051413 TaxID=3239899 RepID=UPI003D98ECEC
MKDTLGANTRDILALGHQHPAEHQLTDDERETRTRKFGHRCFFAGAGIDIAAVVGSLFLTLSTEGPTVVNPTAQMFGVFTLIALIVSGASLVVVSGVERLQRPQRTMARLVLAETRRAHQRLDTLIATLGAIPDRMDTLEKAIEKVPGYTEGVIHGVQLRTDALGSDHD